MTKVFVCLEVACLLFIAFMALSAFWLQDEDFGAAVGMVFFGGPALLVQVICMTLVLVSKSEIEIEKRHLPWRTSVSLALVGAGLFAVTLATA